MKRLLITILLSWFTFVTVSSIPRVRAVLAAPLVITDESADGDACYVLAGGNALWERLSAAADLYHMKRIPEIYLMRNGETGPYNFVAHANWTQTQWAVSYLCWKGVPKESITVIEEVNGSLGTLREAENIARMLPPDIKKLVLVTSAPHTRRSLFTFRKLLPASMTVVPYAATSVENSAELSDPIWLEYLKLLVYEVYLRI